MIPLALTAMLLLSAVLAACGGSSGDGDDEGINPTEFPSEGYYMATFTPVPPDYTPEAFATIEAARTELSERRTATAAVSTPAATEEAESTAPTSTPSNTGEIVFPTPPAEGDDVVYPPLAVLTTGVGNFVGGSIGTYNWFEESAESGGTFQAPWIVLSIDSAVTVSGDDATILFQDELPKPVTTKIEIFTAEGNVVIPTDLSGKPSADFAFVRQTDPVFTTSIEGPELTFVLDLEPDIYLVLATVTWPQVEGLEEYGDQMTEYMFRVTVE